jgi:ribosomal protein L28
VQLGGTTKRMNVCTRCIKAGKVTKPVRRASA